MKVALALFLLGMLVCCADFLSRDNPHHQSCEDRAQTECELFLCKYDRWAEEVCRDWTGCCYCKCWFDGRKFPEPESTAEECICYEEPMPDEWIECRGSALLDAEQCLSDEKYCQSFWMESVGEFCEYWFP